MAENRLELVVDLQSGRAEINAKSLDKTIAGMGKTAESATNRGSRSVDVFSLRMTAAVAAGNALYAGVRRLLQITSQYTAGTIRAADETAKNSQKLGLSVQTYSQLRMWLAAASLLMGPRLPQIHPGSIRPPERVYAQARNRSPEIGRLTAAPRA